MLCSKVKRGEGGAYKEVNADVSEDDDNDSNVKLVFLDATWKYASDMEKKNTELGIFWSVMIIVKLSL